MNIIMYAKWPRFGLNLISRYGCESVLFATPRKPHSPSRSGAKDCGLLSGSDIQRESRLSTVNDSQCEVQATGLSASLDSRGEYFFRQWITNRTKWFTSVMSIEELKEKVTGLKISEERTREGRLLSMVKRKQTGSWSQNARHCHLFTLYHQDGCGKDPPANRLWIRLKSSCIFPTSCRVWWRDL